jgi:hypothetical protein
MSMHSEWDCLQVQLSSHQQHYVSETGSIELIPPHCELSASCLDRLMIKIQTARRKLTNHSHDVLQHGIICRSPSKPYGFRWRFLVHT